MHNSCVFSVHSKKQELNLIAIDCMCAVFKYGTGSDGQSGAGLPQLRACVLLKREKAESEAQRGKPKGTLESEGRNAIV